MPSKMNFTLDCVILFLLASLAVAQDINECLPNPCENGGTCTDGINMYTCTCVAGYEGDDCQTYINECLSNPCEKGGTCTDQIAMYTCTCVAGYTDDECQTNINECMSTPCYNGGTCVDGNNEYVCLCRDTGFDGVRCLNNIDECAGDPCENGGTCRDEINAYTCTCMPGFNGHNCQININECLSSPCINGGTCMDEINSYTCACVDGWTGPLCEVDTNECASLPCLNDATCLNEIAMFTCQCLFGYSGTYCQTFDLCDLEGDWYNECNDKLTIVQTSTSMLLGDYITNVELLTGMSASTIALGYAEQNPTIPTFGFTVIRNNGQSTTSWTGQCQICDEQEVLYSTWINIVAANTCADVKQATKIGQDRWTRYMQSQAPKED